MTDWFRHSTWSAEDEADFFGRLSRSRDPQSKAQYLRIQASHLADTGDRARVSVALNLLDRLLREFPEPIQLAPALWERARCQLVLGDVDAALTSYRQAVDAEHRFPAVQTAAKLDFAWLVATERIRGPYDEALAHLEAYEDTILLPVQTFRFCAARAIIASDRGDASSATTWARAALESAERTDSGLGHHKDLGLVGAEYGNVVEQMRRWAVA